MAVSFTVYSSTPETWYKAIGFCLLGTVLSFLSPQWCIKIQKSSVCFCKLQRGLVWLDEEGKSIFLHFTEAYIIFLLPVKQNVFSTGSLVLVMVKKNKKKTKSEMKKKKVVVPNATMQIPPHRRHLVEVQVLGKVDHQNNGIRSEGSDFSEKMALEKCFGGLFFERDDC